MGPGPPSSPTAFLSASLSLPRQPPSLPLRPISALQLQGTRHFFLPGLTAHPGSRPGVVLTPLFPAFPHLIHQGALQALSAFLSQISFLTGPPASSLDPTTQCVLSSQ